MTDASEGPAGRILILGATGMAGHQLFFQASRRPHWQAFGSVREGDDVRRFFPPEAVSRLLPDVDAMRFDSVRTAIEQIRPDVVINAVGVIKQVLDRVPPEEMIELNAAYPHRLAAACGRVGARLVHISTDCVFAGTTGNYSEASKPDATDLYGLSKHLGEGLPAPSVVVRTSFIGHELRGRRSLVEWFLAQRRPVGGYVRAMFSGLTSNELARLILDEVVPDRELTGIIHVGADPISKYELLRVIAAEYGIDVPVNPDDTPAPDRTLDSSLFRNRSGYRPPTWHELVAQMRRNHLAYVAWAQTGETAPQPAEEPLPGSTANAPLRFEPAATHVHPLSAPVRQLLAASEGAALDVALAVDEQGALREVLMREDLRSVLLREPDLERSLSEIVGEIDPAAVRPPRLDVTADRGSIAAVCGSSATGTAVLVDAAGQPQQIAWIEPARPVDSGARGFILAGGKGTRLGRLTLDCPKPMLPIGGRPLLQWTIDRLVRHGIRDITIATHYLPEVIERGLDVSALEPGGISFQLEEKPLGTAGGLSLMPPADIPTVVMNGDVLTTVDFSALLRHHRMSGAALTVGIRWEPVRVLYGVADIAAGRIVGMREKPAIDVPINAGIYVVAPDVVAALEPGKSLTMVELMENVLDQGGVVTAFPIVEYWRDIGTPAEYHAAGRDIATMRETFSR